MLGKRKHVNDEGVEEEDAVSTAATASSTTLDKYAKMFKRPPKSTTTTLSISSNVVEWRDVEYCEEMSALMRRFATFDPINDLSQHCATFNGNNDAQSLDFNECMTDDDYRGRVVVSYLRHENFTEDLLKTRTWDHVVHALMTYLLSSPLRTLLWVKHNYPEYGGLIAAVHDEKLVDTHNRPLFLIDTTSTCASVHYEWIYTRAPFKLLNKYFHPHISEERVATFHITDHLELSFINELHHFHSKLLDNKVDESLVLVLESFKSMPHDLEHIIGDYMDICGESTVRYFTGQACCGKTTLVQKLNFEAKSRGSIGGFSGKADSLASVSCLHFSIDFVLRQYKNVIGVSIEKNECLLRRNNKHNGVFFSCVQDRGNIDNTLWLWIMNHCGVEHQGTLVSDLLRFIDSTFNAATIGYFMTQNVVIFIDPQPLLNAERMLRRGTGGDSTRGRIKYYAHTQALAYYTMARLFGWKVFCVPYDYTDPQNPTFAPEKYSAIADYINASFALPSLPCPSDELTVRSFEKPSNEYLIDNTYAKAVGIYK